MVNEKFQEYVCFQANSKKMTENKGAFDNAVKSPPKHR
jgi:hypothetical protein